MTMTNTHSLQGGARRPHAFTLIELMVVMIIIAILAALTLGGFQFANQWSRTAKSEANIEFVKTALETYSQRFGEYPSVLKSPHSPDGLDISAAAALYQAISGDGSDYILSDGTASDGQYTEEEIRDSIAEVPPSMVGEASDGTLFLIDGFGNPIFYRRADMTNAINPTFDIWSTANDNSTPSLNGDYRPAPATWITNW